MDLFHSSGPHQASRVPSLHQELSLNPIFTVKRTKIKNKKLSHFHHQNSNTMLHNPQTLVCVDQTHRVVFVMPIPNENADVPIWLIKWYGNHRPVVDGDAPVPPSSSLEAQWGEVEEATDLVLHLEPISVVPARRDGTVGAQDSILPRSSSLLYPYPSK